MHLTPENNPIAVVGYAGIFPGAPDPDRLWRRIVEKKEGIGEVPNNRWALPPERILQPAGSPDRAVSTRAGLIAEFDFDPESCRLPGSWVRRLDPLHHLSICAGKAAWTSFASSGVDTQRAGVILAAIALPTDAASRLCRDLVQAHLSGVLFGERRRVAHDTGAAAAARVTGLPAALVAGELGLGGVQYTLDAACASSLYAVKLACDELGSGRADVMLAGGVSRPDCLYTQIGFSQLRALSPSGKCAAFDAAGDGLVVGEGCGILVLKRLADALADRDRIRGVIRGIGLSNDMRGNLLAPDSEGQLRAMNAAYQKAGWRPDQVDLIECHGAGTPVGDRTEVESLNRLWDGLGARPGTCPIGSVKTVIGHLLVAAGAAGMIKTLLALEHKTLPPSLHFSAPPKGSPLADGPFRVQTEPERWRRRSGQPPRRAAVSAFGFGGINAHLLLEEWAGAPAAEKDGPEPVVVPRRRPPGGGVEISDRSAGPASLPPVAVVGLAAAFGSAPDAAGVRDALASGVGCFRERPRHRWKGIEAVLPESQTDGMALGAFLEQIRVQIGEFKIPPSEIPEILPQHLLMLQVAAQALADAGIEAGRERPGAGAVVGIDFDHEATGFQLRWHLEAESESWSRRLGISFDRPEAARWFSELKDACAPPLNADRTLGALAGLIGSRIAREFAFGGPSFTVSDGPAAGLRALEIAARSLALQETDLMLVGAVDLAGDVRASWTARAVDPAAVAGDGAAAVVLKRLDRAVADGDTVYAVLRGVGTAAGGGPASGEVDPAAWTRSLTLALDQAGIVRSDVRFLDTAGPLPTPPHFDALPSPSRTETWAGSPGAAAGMAAMVRSLLCLYEMRLGRGRPERSAARPDPAPETPQRACAAVSTREGACVHAIFEEMPHPPAAATESLPVRSKPRGPVIALPAGGRPLAVPDPPVLSAHPEVHAAPGHHATPTDRRPRPEPAPLSGTAAVARAHEKFLDFSAALHRAYASALQQQSRLIEAAAEPETLPDLSGVRTETPPPAYDRQRCMEFAVGSAEKVLGPEFAELDTFRVRVRLPDEPLMLVDRILAVEGEKGSLSSGRVVTEHDVLADAWYLDGGKAPVCISVEAGQADLFLCSYLGIDLRVRGERAYRLLDATVSFHRGLPEPGDTIRYEIEIEKFVRQGDTWLFFFHFDGYVGDQHLITMTEGCAGFFTPEEVENSGGILLTDADARREPPASLKSWAPPTPLRPEHYDEDALNALRAGDAEGCFGEGFAGVAVPEPLRLPGGRMHLIDRVPALDPSGGRWGAGSIRAEADIHPDAWYLTCHFVDDMVMPGTLMYECCAHTLRVFLQRMGWFTDAPETVYEPKPGVRSVLKCRGPVTPKTRSVVYEVEIRETGFDPCPYVIADAHMFADGRRIVMFRDMSIQVTGLTREKIDGFWRRRAGGAVPPSRKDPPPGTAASSSDKARSVQVVRSGPPVFTREQILAYARGRPSEAFGSRYAPFDEDRFLARLPSPPYSFIHRVVRVEPAAEVMAPGGWIEAEVDVTPDDWYFVANRTPSMPFAVLQEAALQVCGFTSAYVGSSLTTDKDLRYRNLGGEAVQHRDVAARKQVLTSRCRLVGVSSAADMILQDFEMAVLGDDGAPIYSGKTHFGFFTEKALANQVGIRDAEGTAPIPDSDGPAGKAIRYLEATPPLHPGDPDREPIKGAGLPAKALLMIDRIDAFDPAGGPHGLGRVQGSKKVDPAEWFFAAHFFQDPVCPGSLGLESLLQLLKFAALQRFGPRAESMQFAPALGETHRWTYRGQILPTHRTVTVTAAVTRIETSPDPLLLGSGVLRVDGLPIYRMENFGVRLVEKESEPRR